MGFDGGTLSWSLLGCSSLNRQTPLPFCLINCSFSRFLRTAFRVFFNIFAISESVRLSIFSKRKFIS